MTDLDRRVAKLRGWTINRLSDPITGYEDYWCDYTRIEPMCLVCGYSPSTNLLQAVALWDEAKPAGWCLWVIQGDDNVWQVGRKLRDQAYHAKFVSFPDLPRAITQAWVEAMGAT